ncbi:Carn-acyltransf domain-containing protein [Aphelenchoides bicaudatus]|nr:Carn-acyltransf domain-containing protein [Aphelenchoides bicaudatus]
MTFPTLSSTNCIQFDQPPLLGFFVSSSHSFVCGQNNQNEQSLVTICACSLAFSLLPVFVLRAFLWIFYFRYKGYVYENPKKPSLATKFWFVCSKILQRLAPPRLETCDSLLPRQSVPYLKDTVNKYLKSMQPILEEDEYIELKNLAREFEDNEGRKLNLYATLYSYITRNYITPFWEKYLYLYSRSPLLINSNVGHVDTHKILPTTQTFRAAELCYVAALNMTAIENQTQKPIGHGLVFNGHYKKLYCTTRVPKVGCDELVVKRYSRHVAVLANKRFYKVDLFDKNNRLYSVEELEEIFIELLLRKHEAEPTDVEQKLASLTQDHRDQWAVNRNKFFIDHPVNRHFLEQIEDAIVFVVLDENSYNYESNEELTRFQHEMLKGDGKNRWTDKSMSFIVGKDGHYGGNSEHSLGDGAEFDTVMENFVRVSNSFINRPTNPINIDELKDYQPKSGVKLAERLEFEVFNSEMESEIERCYLEQLERNNDLDSASMHFKQFGKDSIKKANCSPDAFIQMAIQLTSYREQKKFVSTYESASSRFFDFSRTETLRTVCDESCDFVKSMVDNSATKEERAKLLHKACSNHQQTNRKITVGEGFDRHLFVLYVLSKGLEMKSTFLETFANTKWLLSTSQPPNMTNQLDENNETEQWMGGGFGAVSHEGYGICYRCVGNDSIVFHITSYHSAPNTNSARFRQQLEDTLGDMINLFSV